MYRLRNLLKNSTKMHATITIFFIFTFCINFCVCKKYNNYTLFRGIPVDTRHLQYFMNMSRSGDFNFWRYPGLLYKPVEFVVSPENKPSIMAEAERHELYLTTILEDVQQAFDKQTVKTYIRTDLNSYDWSNFFRLDDIYMWLSDLALAHPKEMTVHSIGKTEEKREIMAVKIVMTGCKMRSKVMVEAGIHAREWLGPAFVTYLIDEIIQSPTSGNDEIKEIALTYEWFFVPVLNPDGYEYSHTTDRLWRKNRNGEGVDLNRNFNTSFGTVGISTVKTADTYCGPSEFSEKESKAMRRFVASESSGLEYYLAFHSYGQNMIIPYGDSKEHLENFDEVNEKCTEAAAKIETKFKTMYATGTAYDTLGYTISGVSSCWVKRTYHVPYVVTFELRDGGFYGFALPVHKILPTCQETMDGLISLLTPKTPAYDYTPKMFRATYDSPNSARTQFVLNKIMEEKIHDRELWKSLGEAYAKKQSSLESYDV